MTITTFEKSGKLYTFQRLWCSWAVKSPEKSFYFAGDTGFCDSEFEKIGKKLGPFDLAAIPIGAYEPKYESILVAYTKSCHFQLVHEIPTYQPARSRASTQTDSVQVQHRDPLGNLPYGILRGYQMTQF